MESTESPTPAVARRLAHSAEIHAARARMRARLHGRERTASLVSAGGFVVAAVTCAFLVPSERGFSLAVFGLLVALYGILSQIEFEIGPGSAVPTELVLVPMLFVLPPGIVPLAVATALVAGGIVDRLRGHLEAARITVLLSSSWHSIGPALVIGFLASGSPAWAELDVYLLALLAQFTFDIGAVTFRHTLGRGVPARRLVEPLGRVILVDLALAPIGLLAAFTAASEPLAVICVIPLAALLKVLETERRERIDDSVVLGRAAEDASREARSDPLTGVGNRLAWEESLERVAASDDGVVSVLVVDVDDLKETNDTYGHDAGDRLICAVAAALERALRDGDELARIGGDEFAAVVTGLDEDGCAGLVERIRSEVAEVHMAPGVVASASIGVASSPPAGSIVEAVRLADERLYRGKLGRIATSP